ncbi:LysM peptidoglycan-binding domain-containing protein [Rossellomorea vietnamensis]|uniref:LysM peptidoglycan-binding domain-containing protein n=1 Tax=Rossellomorea vietnamensis TaxID=218284 RepID=A0A5D4MFB3_9BACI|nr:MULTISPECIES: LysM peptidoglycan-binding domain-containing protein [Bacillaceae]TYS00580.1 LysM peptidoglycan-binding domain-containing protein [Rossellomorea vietnamensis]
MSRDPYRAQAEKLRQKIERVEPAPEQEVKQKRSLPKRSDVHQEKRKKIKYPLIKGMLAFFVLLPIVMYGLYSSLDVSGNENRSVVTETGQMEEVTYESKEVKDEVKSGTTEENKEIVDSESAAATAEPDDSPKAEEEEVRIEEVSEENIVQLNDQEESVQEDEFGENVQVIEHIVEPQETLFRIAMNYYKSQEGIEKIKEWNNIDQHDLEAGQVLKIPLPVD